MSGRPWGHVGSGLSGSDTEAGRRADRFHGSVEVGTEDAALHARVTALSPVFPRGTSSAAGLSDAGRDAAARAARRWLKHHVHFNSAVTSGSARVFRDGVAESDLEWRAADRLGSLLDTASETCDRTPGGHYTGWRVDHVQIHLRSCGVRRSFFSTLQHVANAQMNVTLRCLRRGRFARGEARRRQRMRCSSSASGL